MAKRHCRIWNLILWGTYMWQPKQRLTLKQWTTFCLLRGHQRKATSRKEQFGEFRRRVAVLSRLTSGSFVLLSATKGYHFLTDNVGHDYSCIENMPDGTGWQIKELSVISSVAHREMCEQKSIPNLNFRWVTLFPSRHDPACAQQVFDQTLSSNHMTSILGAYWVVHYSCHTRWTRAELVCWKIN